MKYYTLSNFYIRYLLTHKNKDGKIYHVRNLEGEVIMGGNENIKRICSFYVSNAHLVTMLLPYIKKQLDLNIGIYTLLEYNYAEYIEQILSKLMGEISLKESILNINWNTKNSCKFNIIEKEIKEKLGKNKELNILIAGSNRYISAAGENLDKFFIKNAKKIYGKYITIIDCFEVTEFNDNIREILDGHDGILNTSGIHPIADVFDGYEKKKIAN